MRTKKILSIDFDYFIHYTNRRSPHFCPDSGIEFSRSVSNVVWGTKYAGAQAAGLDMMQLLSTRTSDLEFIKRLIRMQELSQTMVCDSHLHMIDFVDSLYEPDACLQIYNVDAHHDAFPIEFEDDVHCGNWLTALLADGTAEKAYWLSPPDEPYTPASPELCDPKVDTSLQLSDLANEGPFEYIFLCQSSSWLPPHLDPAFLELAALLIPPEGGYPCRIQTNIMESRYTAGFRKEIADLISYMPKEAVVKRK